MEFFLKDYFRKQEMHHKIIYNKFRRRKIPPGSDLYYWDLIWKTIFIAQLKTAKPRNLYNRNADMTLIPEEQRV